MIRELPVGGMDYNNFLNKVYMTCVKFAVTINIHPLYTDGIISCKK